MGACCSKTTSTLPSSPTPPEVKFKPNPDKTDKNTAAAIVATVTETEAPKKEVFVVKHRKSLETDRNSDQVTRKSTDRKEKASNSGHHSDVSQPVVGAVVVGATVRMSSCTKEEVDAILIQCGRLSRSSSGVKPAGGETPTRGRRYSGSKRSFDFDMEVGSKNDEEEVAVDGDGHRRRQQREVRVSSPSSRRGSRERDPQQQRSGCKERGSGSGGRRVSRSPNRRSESPNPNSNSTYSAVVGGGSNRPGKMVSVPATDKTNNAGAGEVVGGAVKRIQVKRNAGEAAARTAASPRSRSPRTIRVLNENQNPQPVTLSRSNSRKAEQSPYRRNPLGEIDTNAAGSEQLGRKKQNCEKAINNKTNNVKNCVTKEAQMIDENKTTVENPKHSQIVSRTRSSRLSRDLDINPEALLNPNPTPNPPSYASLLLEDIQNFHQKNPVASVATPPPPAFSLPACVSKACSILEAVADLNSATSSNDRQFKKENLVECEKVVNDDLMEPSFHKYVTVKRGGDADAEERESSGSNSFAGSQQLSWMSSSWEPNSGDSTNCWTSNSRSNGRDTEVQDQVVEYPRNGIGRGRLGVHVRSAYSLPNNATVAST
ncbi:hypothetical protein L1987_33996 [Smallanthus sonchifolius]|uniref:Uncharacterized protein n=1 Tax=Smallanthus sonchifolius TaxID=185202 RepID=A0ACB9HTG4_9ASTR|nr:hypothetical protein L1987_33996 [Smallanthus sonchifolius]